MWVAISAGIASVVISSLCIVAFLGRFVGTFTVSLDTGNVELALSDKGTFEKMDSFLRINAIPTFHEFSYSSLPADDVLDSDETDYLTGAFYEEDGKTPNSMNYFKYTFFVRNIGKITARYIMKINITDNKAGENGRTLDDTLRVMLYDNDAIDTNHKKVVYAKRAAVHHINEDGVADFHEPISVSEDGANEFEPFAGYAEMFETSSCIATLVVDSFVPGETRRYTIVNWLEGYDPQSNNYSAPPKGARIKLGVEINAYEI